MELRSELEQVCREHEIAPEILEGNADDDQLLDRLLEACEHQTVDSAAGSAEGVRRMQGLIRLVRRLRAPRVDPAELRAVDRGLRRADAQSRCLERQLADAMSALDAEGDGTGSDSDRLNQLFLELSRLCHKINNPLTSVLGRAQIMQLKMKSQPDPAMARPVQVIEESAKRVAALVQELANLVGIGRRLYSPDHEPSASAEKR